MCNSCSQVQDDRGRRSDTYDKNTGPLLELHEHERLQLLITESIFMILFMGNTTFFFFFLKIRLMFIQ